MTEFFDSRFNDLWAAVLLRQVTMEEAWQRLDFLWRYCR